jgi:hypothetical protein
MYIRIPTPLRANADDEIGDSTYVVIWSYLEDYTAVIFACLIAIRPLLIKYVPFVFGSKFDSHNQASFSASAAKTMGPQSAATIWARRHASAIGLKSKKSEKTWMDGESAQEEERGLEVWVTKSVELDDTSATGLKTADSGKAWLDGDSAHEEGHGFKIWSTKSVEGDEKDCTEKDKDQY